PERALIADEESGGAVGGKLGRYLTKGKGYYEFLLRTVAREPGSDPERPFGTLSGADQALLLHGSGAKPIYHVKIEKGNARFQLEERFTAPRPGLCGDVDAGHRKSEDPEWRAILERTMAQTTCDVCQGERLAP